MLSRVLPLVALLFAWPCQAEWQFQTVEGAGGVPLNVVTAGDPAKPTLFFIHGIGQSHYSFVRQLDSDLAQDFHLVTFDLRGHGASGKPWGPEAYGTSSVWAEDVASVMQATGTERPVIVAWSFGTLVVMDYLREYGVADVAGVVLTGGLGAITPPRPPPADDPNADAFAEARKLQTSPDLVDNIRATDRMVDWLTATPLPDDTRHLFQGVSLMLPAYARREMVSRPFNNQDLLPRLTMPLLFSLGGEDNPGSLIDGKVLAEENDHIELSVYEGVGHTVFFESPQRFNDELRRFAERVQ